MEKIIKYTPEKQSKSKNNKERNEFMQFIK